MDDLPRQRLGELLVRQGRGLIDDPRRLEALLRDLCPQQRREVNLLTGAARERVPADLLSSSDGMPKAVLVARLQQRLEENLGLAPDAARWAVESWGLALGVIAAGDLQAPSSAGPSPSVRPPAPAAPRPLARTRAASASPPVTPPRVSPSPTSVARPAPASPPPPTVRAAAGSASGPPADAGRSPQPPAGLAPAPPKRSGALFVFIVAVVAVAVGGVVVAARGGSRGSNNNRASGQQPTAPPCYTGTTPPAPALGASAGNPVGPCPASGPPSNADALYRALLAASFSTGELPPGFSVHDITSRQPNGDETRLHAAGVVIVELDSSAGVGSANIEYVVYPGDAGAQADYDASKTRQVVGGTALGNFTPTGANGLPGPSVCQFGIRQDTPAAGCLLRSGQTVVLSFASRQGGQTAGEADAVALEIVGVAHLERVANGR